MRITKRTVATKGVVAAGAVASLLLMTASPAMAAHTIVGAGLGTGGDMNTIDDSMDCGNPLPIAVGTSDYVLDITDTGTYSGVDTAGVVTAAYVGNSFVHIEAEPHFISPIGTHSAALGPLTLCTVPTPVAIKVTVTSPGAGGTGGTAGGGAGVHCDEVDGTMIRVQSAVSIAFTGQCSIKGNQPLLTGFVNNTLTAHVLEGELTPCFAPPPFSETNPNPACALQRAAQPPGLATYPSDVGALWLGTYSAGGATP